MLVLKQQVEALKRIAAERVTQAERDELLKAQADKVVMSEELEYLRRQNSDIDNIKKDLEHYRKRAIEGLALKHEVRCLLCTR